MLCHGLRSEVLTVVGKYLVRWYFCINDSGVYIGSAADHGLLQLQHERNCCANDGHDLNRY